MKSAYRRSSAEVFDLALRLACRHYSVSAIQIELAQMLGREVPVSRPALDDWRHGRTAVDLEVLAALCTLANATLRLEPDGRMEVKVERGDSRAELRPAVGDGRLHLSFVPGALALGVCLLLVLWAASFRLPQMVVMVAAAYKTVVSTVPSLGAPATVAAAPLEQPPARSVAVHMAAATDAETPTPRQPAVATTSTPAPPVKASADAATPPPGSSPSPVVAATPPPPPTPAPLPSVLPSPSPLSQPPVPPLPPVPSASPPTSAAALIPSPAPAVPAP